MAREGESTASRHLAPLPGRGAAAGAVWLVGAGPGDPDLLTIKALKALQGADVVVHDGLVSAEVLALASREARLLNVEKRKSRHTLPQEDIGRLIVGLAQQGLTVVRLKGGDPFVFGRGGEELLACRAAGVPCHVVPGVTAALASGAPLTHRGLAQAVTLVTAHARVGADGRPAAPDLDWAALARPNQTVAVYMGLTAAAGVAERLMAAGRAGATPVLVTVNASRADEQRVLTTLAELPEAARQLAGPAMIVIGEVAALADLDSPADVAPDMAAAERLRA